MLKNLILTTTELKIAKTNIFNRLYQSTKPVVVCVGGSGSSKSHSMAQLFIAKFLNEKNKVFGICRKTLPALKMTAYKLIVDLLIEYKYYSPSMENKSDHTIKFGTNQFQFFGLDDPQRKKSFLCNYLWLEEASEFSKDDILTLRLCLKSNAGRQHNQMFLTFNPVECPIYDLFENDPKAEWIESTYHDNPFATESFIDILEELKEKDLNYYNIYALGKRGKLENIIYPNWQLIEEFPPELDWQAYGVDFGYEHPSVCIHIGVLKDKLYLDELLYETHLTNTDLIDRLKSFPKHSIYADSSEPQRIEEFCRARLNTYPAKKDVKLGIDTVKRYAIFITKRSVNLIKEIRTYQRKKDKDGKILDEPVDYNDHAMDSLRYAIMGKPRRWMPQSGKRDFGETKESLWKDL